MRDLTDGTHLDQIASQLLGRPRPVARRHHLRGYSRFVTLAGRAVDERHLAALSEGQGNRVDACRTISAPS